MDEFLSFIGVIALWIAVSYAVWWIYQRATGASDCKRVALAGQAEARVAEAAGIFDHIRGGASAAPKGEQLTRETHALLKRIQEYGGFFDAVNALRQRIAGALGEECEPLAEILHIRRDLWAASEIVLVEDPRALGPELEDEREYARLHAEAVRLLFLDPESASGEDLIRLRVALARDDARAFVADVEETIRLVRERQRLPTASEIIAYPVGAVRAVPGKIRNARAQAAAFAAQVKAVAVAIQNSETMTRGLGELARARQELPQRAVSELDKARHTARQGAANLKGHYDFLVAAYDFQARYERVLRRAPVLSDRGRQFIARLELAERSERLKLTSATLRDAFNRALVRSLAHLIAMLQRAQRALEARLAKRGAPAGEQAANTSRSSAETTVAATARPQTSAPPRQRRSLSARLAERIAEGEDLLDPSEIPSDFPDVPAESAKPQWTPPRPMRLAPVLKGVDPNAFDAVLAWYTPAIASANAPRPASEILDPAALPAFAAPAPAAAEPSEDGPAKDRRKTGGGWFKWFGRSRSSRYRQEGASPSL